MKYAVNEEGVSAIQSTANSVQSSLEAISALTNKIRSSASNYCGCIGPHESSLEEALEQIEESVKSASEPANSVAEKLNEVAEAYEEIISNDPYLGSGTYVDADERDSTKAQGAKTLRR